MRLFVSVLVSACVSGMKTKVHGSCLELSFRLAWSSFLNFTQISVLEANRGENQGRKTGVPHICDITDILRSTSLVNSTQYNSGASLTRMVDKQERYHRARDTNIQTLTCHDSNIKSTEN